MKNDATSRLLGAAIGAAVGVTAHWLLLRTSLQMAGVAGMGVALGVSAGAQSRNVTWGVVTALLAVALSVVTEWWFRPFVADRSLAYFVAHLSDLPALSLASLAAAAVVGCYLGLGRRQPRTSGVDAA